MDDSELLLGSVVVALFGEELGKARADGKSRRVFGLRSRAEVLLEPEDRSLRLALRVRQARGSIDEGGTVVLVKRGAGVCSGHHVVETAKAAVVGGKIHPRARRIGRLPNGGFEISLRGGVVFLGFGDARLQIECPGSADGLQLRDECLRTVEAPPYDGRGVGVIFAKIGQRFGIARIELHGLLELSSDFACQYKGAHQETRSAFCP